MASAIPYRRSGAATSAPEPRGFLARWVILVLGMLLTAGMIAAVAGAESVAVFQTFMYAIFVLPVIGAAWMLGILLSAPFTKKNCFENSPWPAGYRSLVAIALGLGAFALGTLLLGTFHLLEPGGNSWALALLPVAGAACGIIPARNFLRNKTPKEGSFLLATAHRGDWLFLLAAVPAAILLIAATFPPGSLWQTEALGYDVMEYHLQLPREYAFNNSTAPLHHNMYSFFPSNVEMLYLLLMQLAKATIAGDRATGYLWGTFPAQFFHAMLMILTAAAIALMPLGTREKPWLQMTGRAIAVLVFLGIPWTLVTGSLAYNEGGMLFFGTLAMGVAIDERKESSRARGVLIGLLLGLAVGCKMTAGVFFALPIAAILLTRAVTDGAQIRSLTLATVVAVAVYSPSALRAAVYSGGNPVFPIATNLLPKDGWSAEQSERFNRGHSAPVAQRPLTARLKALADNSLFDPQWSVQPYALLQIAANPPAPLDTPWKRLGLLWLAVPLAVAGAFITKPGRGEAMILLGIFGLQLIAWLFATHLQARFLLPAAIPVALLMGRGVQGLQLAAEGIFIAALRIAGGTLIGLHALCAVFLLLPEARLLGGVVPLGDKIVPPPPIGELFSRVIDVAAAMEHPDAPPATTDKGASAKILLIGDATAWRFVGDVEYFTVFDRHPFAEVLRGKNPADIRHWLQNENIRYVWIDWDEVKRLRATYGFDAAFTTDVMATLAKAGLEDTQKSPRSGLIILRVSESKYP